MTNHWWRCSLLGQPGCGKTRAVLTLPEDFYPVGMIDIDDKAGEMPELMPLRRAGKLDIFPVREAMIPNAADVRERLVSNSVLSRVPLAVVRTLEIANYISGDTTLAKSDPNRKPYKTLMIDTWSSLVEHIERSALFCQTSGLLQGWNDWQKYRSIMEELIDGLKKQPINLIVNCHIGERVQRSGSGTTATEKRWWEVQIKGSFKDRYAGYFNEVYFMRRTKKAGSPDIRYVMDLRSTDAVPCRTNIQGIPNTIYSDLRPPIELWRAQMLGLPMEKWPKVRDAKAELTGG
jgi:hypothetical protein